MKEPTVAETSADAEALAADFRRTFRAVTDEVARVIVGCEEVVEQTLAALVIGGNVLVEGVPGLGKTLLLLSLARACDLRFRRVQFTPDLMPADITGTHMISQAEGGRRAMAFVPGPVFTHLLLADEINRATPRTQSALLEAMEEHTVSTGGRTRRLEEPFFVMATQNPIEQEGTYPLPEAALDKFAFKLLVDVPEAHALQAVLERTTGAAAPEAHTVASRDAVLGMRRTAMQVPVATHVEDFAIRVVTATRRSHPAVRSGAGPRALRALLLGARVRALVRGRYHVSADDIQALAPAALRHRITLSFEAESQNVTPDAAIRELLSEVAP